MFLTDDEFEELQNMEFSQNDWLWFYTQAVENKLLEKLKAQEPMCWMTPSGEGWMMRTEPPTIDTKLGWTALYEHPLPPDDVVRDAVEKWVPVEGFDGFYEVSSTGRVRSLDRVDSDGNKRRGKIMRPSSTTKGYLKVTFWMENKKSERYVHRLVANAFCNRPSGSDQVNHKDGDPKNNLVSNLEWVTAKENTEHASKILKRMGNKPIKGVHVKTGNVIIFQSFSEAEAAGFTRSLIGKCINGEREHHRNYAWFYLDAAIDAAMKEMK